MFRSTTDLFLKSVFYLLLSVLGLVASCRLSLVVASVGYTLVAVRWFLIAEASFFEHRL